MKTQDVILKAMSGQYKWLEAAEILGITDRTMRRWRQRYEEHGYDGLYDYRKQQPSPKRVPMATLEKVLHLYREKYYDFNVRHFHEKLADEHEIDLSRRAGCLPAFAPSSAQVFTSLEQAVGTTADNSLAIKADISLALKTEHLDLLPTP